MKLAIWSTSTPPENSTYPELFQRKLEEIELAERIGIDQVWFLEHHLIPTSATPSPNLLIAAASQRTRPVSRSSARPARTSLRNGATPSSGLTIRPPRKP